MVIWIWITSAEVDFVLAALAPRWTAVGPLRLSYSPRGKRPPRVSTVGSTEGGQLGTTAMQTCPACHLHDARLSAPFVRHLRTAVPPVPPKRPSPFRKRPNKGRAKR